MFAAPNQRWSLALAMSDRSDVHACWIFFYKVHLVPAQGYYVWMAGHSPGTFLESSGQGVKSPRKPLTSNVISS